MTKPKTVPQEAYDDLYRQAHDGMRAKALEHAIALGARGAFSDDPEKLVAAAALFETYLLGDLPKLKQADQC